MNWKRKRINKTMETTTQHISPEIAAVIADNERFIAEVENYLVQNGTQFPLTEWLTIAEYTKQFGLKSTMVVTNWMKRGVIPKENILHVPELNDIRLIKAVPYTGGEPHE